MSCILIFLFIIRFRKVTHEGFKKFLIIFFYCFREIYVSLLSTQYWSFIASILDKNTSGYLVKYTAVVSIASAIGGYCVQVLVGVWGVKGLLITTIIAVLLSTLCAEIATLLTYEVKSENIPQTPNQTQSSSSKTKLNIWRDSYELFYKYDILKLLYLEAIAHQSCSNMLNMMFYDMLRKKISDNVSRASVVGYFFATVNVITCTAQLFILPSLLSRKSLPYILLFIPIVVFVFISITYIYESSFTIMLAFGSLKVLEYSVMTSATEMMYMPFNEDVRYLGRISITHGSFLKSFLRERTREIFRWKAWKVRLVIDFERIKCSLPAKHVSSVNMVLYSRLILDSFDVLGISLPLLQTSRQCCS